MTITRLCGTLVLLAGCAPVAPDPAPILKAAAEYAAYGRVSDLLRWGPLDCKVPAPAPPRMSVSRDPDTHGRKLYHLYARHFDAYRMSHELPQPVGQVLVKESWFPVARSTAQQPVVGDKGPLFVMMKTGEPESDGGWIYATLTPDGRTVTASGKLASCMECHQSKSDRLFGVKSCASAD
jgi:hypothetical protein